MCTVLYDKNFNSIQQEKFSGRQNQNISTWGWKVKTKV
jgi:hypothetical protein